jgi:hypothetical protein
LLATTKVEDVFDDTRLTDRVGKDRFYPTVRDAVAAVSGE